MKDAPTSRLSIAGGLLLARMATRALLALAPDEARWVAGAVELLLFAAEAWTRRGTLSFRRRAGEGRLTEMTRRPANER